MGTPNPHPLPCRRVTVTAIAPLPGIQSTSLRGLETEKASSPQFPHPGDGGWAPHSRPITQQVNELFDQRAPGEPLLTKQHWQSLPSTFRNYGLKPPIWKQLDGAPSRTPEMSAVTLRHHSTILAFQVDLREGCCPHSPQPRTRSTPKPSHPLLCGPRLSIY